MSAFLDLAFSFPTIVFTSLLLVMLGYWLLVRVGALGFELGADGALEGKAGALEAKVGAFEAKTGLLEVLGFGVVPGSIVVTLLVFWAWFLSMVGTAAVG